MDRKNILLALMYVPDEKKTSSLTPIQIMKGLFLLKMKLNLSDTEFYKFEPYLYGPCSFEVYSDLSLLQKQGIVHTEISLLGWRVYRLTSKGISIAERNIKEMDEKILNEIQNIKNIVMSKSFIELLKYVYAEYPEYAKNSIINPEVLER